MDNKQIAQELVRLAELITAEEKYPPELAQKANKAIRELESALVYAKHVHEAGLKSGKVGNTDLLKSIVEAHAVYRGWLKAVKA